MKFDKEKMRLYAITDRHWLNGRNLKEVVKESLDGGVTFLQLEIKIQMMKLSCRKQLNFRNYAEIIRYL